jgi:hypothetical protein
MHVVLAGTSGKPKVCYLVNEAPLGISVKLSNDRADVACLSTVS